MTTRSDTAGNLMAVITKVNGTQTSQIDYAYNDKNFADRLSGLTIDNVTRSIQYSDYCNPLNWFNGTDYTNLTWTQGRRLSSITKGDQTYSYEYDMSGIRSVKIAEGLKHEYVTQNGRVVRDYVTNASTGAFVRCLDFTYDESGHPLTMRRYYNESQTSYNTYHYVLNGQGDVVKLLHGPNKTVAEYTYDAWGNLLSVSPAQSDDPTIAAQNPLRYRGYYYDTETGFYYLQSRYYDPIVRRFINADSYGSTGTGLLGYNMFAYCENNPVNSEDQAGHRPLNVNTMMTDGGGFIPAPCSAYYTPDFVQYCQEHGYTIKEGKTVYYSSSTTLIAMIHYDLRRAKNGPHPTYAEVNRPNSQWTLLPESESVYHNDNIGKPEEKYIHPDGREAVFNGDTHEPMTDPRYMATYNYVPLYKVPANSNVLDYLRCGISYVGHGLFDLLPYYIMGNTPDQCFKIIEIIFP